MSLRFPCSSLRSPQSLNIPGVFGSDGKSTVSYDTFLNVLLSASASSTSSSSLALPGGVEEKIQQRKKYVKWLRGLRTYLRNFIAKTVPLLDVEEEVEKGARDELEKSWVEVSGDEANKRELRRRAKRDSDLQLNVIH